MTQKENLVELIEDSVNKWDFYLYHFDDERLYDDASEEKKKSFEEFISDYLLENGVIVPPCKAGDTVYLIKKKCKYAGNKNEPWNSCEHYWDNVYKRGMWGCAGKDKNGERFECEKKEREWYIQPLEFSLSYLENENIVLGKNLFLTKEEAEKALAEKRVDND